MRRRFWRWWHTQYVRVEPVSMKRAIERDEREALAMSSIVSKTVETAEQQRQRAFWQWAEARRRKPQRDNVRRIA